MKLVSRFADKLREIDDYLIESPWGDALIVSLVTVFIAAVLVIAYFYFNSTVGA